MMAESFNDWGGRVYDDSVSPGRSPKQLLPGIGLHDPHMVGKLDLNSTNFTKGFWSNMSPGGDLLFVSFLSKAGTNLRHPPSPQSLNDSADKQTRRLDRRKNKMEVLRSVI